MNHFFFDTSALVKRYVRETGSRWVDSLVTQPDARVYLSRLAEAEVSAAITRRLSSNAAARLLRHFDHDVATTYIQLTITDSIIDDAVQLTRKHRLRGCDALQLATARQLAHLEPTTHFLCADNELLVAAQAEGLSTDNPELHP
ncbi:MAG: type II toxin-antitoxin system VapC family toxin [Caldilineaceae bacterium]|jgi:hypothetical protein